MTDTLELELAIKRARKTKREYANYLGISEMALYNKIHKLQFRNINIRKESYLKFNFGSNIDIELSRIIKIYRRIS